MKSKFYPSGDSFVIDHYNTAPPFSSFFPALAGVTGKPMWVFYANRGQSIASFGVNNKNGAMLEFLPANKAYQAIPILGFRTFIKHQGDSEHFYEPFSPYNRDSRQTMIIRPYELELRDRNSKWGLETTAVTVGVPTETIPALARELTLRNTTSKTLNLEWVDGLPRILPWGMNDFLAKNMSRTIEAFAEVKNVGQKIPFFKLRVQPDDRPDVKWLEDGFFSFGLSEGDFCPAVVDPTWLFGEDSSFVIPSRWVAGGLPRAGQQLVSSILPSSFFTRSIRLKPRASLRLTFYYGYAGRMNESVEWANNVKDHSSFFDSKRQEMKSIHRNLVDHLGLRTSDAKLNSYAEMTFMDNFLRGGFPLSLSSKGPVLHVYSRKHGDMERDYNSFEVSATYYSQGDANYRDVNQNRRLDLYFNPSLGAVNVESFFNLIQLDGYNPLTMNPVRYEVPRDIFSRIDLKVSEECKAEYEALIKKPVLAGHLYEFIKRYSKDPLNLNNQFLGVLSDARPRNDVKYGEGYWIDHWFYNLDQLDQFLTVFPEKKNWILFEKGDFTYYDPDHFVKPRKEKYIVTQQGELRQYAALGRSPQKEALLASRRSERCKVRTEQGKGEVFKTDLFTKLMGLVTIKVSSLDPFGVGLEMEADKPGWCDALNGLPGLFGSSTHEMYELHRLVLFLMQSALPLIKTKTVELPQEMVRFMREVDRVLSKAGSGDFRSTWDQLTGAREEFREKTFMGISGRMKSLRVHELGLFLRRVSGRLTQSERAAIDPKTGLPTSYFTYDVDVDKLRNGWRQYLGKLPWRQHRLPPFLEGAVHAMKLSSPSGSKKLYRLVKKSALRDDRLKMYKVNAPLGEESLELGRIRVFSAGWLENESVFLHMHYKYLVEILRAGLMDEFFNEVRTGLIPYRDAKTYGRSIFENSSFLVSSNFPDPSFHGRGFVARLTGATVEFLTMLYTLCFGQDFFKYLEGNLIFSPHPRLPQDWFIKEQAEGLSRKSLTLRLFGVPITFVHNRQGKSHRRLLHKPVRYEWILDGRYHHHQGQTLLPEPSLALREGRLENLQIFLS